MRTIGERLRSARLRLALSQEDLAARSGVPVVTISRAENDRFEMPRPATVRKLAEVLDVTPGWLLFGEGEGPAIIAGKDAA
jgi:transcriptional regulator with XRE-family HTH domain